MSIIQANPDFEFAPDGHEYKNDDGVYLIDNNKFDIFKGKITKVSKKGFIVALSEEDGGQTHKVLTPKRILGLTKKNNQIYEQQAKNRNETPKAAQQLETPDQTTNISENQTPNEHQQETAEKAKTDEPKAENVEKIKAEAVGGQKTENIDEQKAVNEEQKVNKECGGDKKEDSDEQKTDSVKKVRAKSHKNRNETPKESAEEDKPKRRSPRKQKPKKSSEKNKEDTTLILNSINDVEDDDNNNNNEDDNDNNNEHSPEQNRSSSPSHRKPKAKKPVFDMQSIIRVAWQNGIHDVKKFKRFAKKNIGSLVNEFEKYHRMMNVSEEPPFSIGGLECLSADDNNDKNQEKFINSETRKFWSSARSQWKKMFNAEVESVDTDDFIHKVAETMKLQNQTEANAREALRFFFDADVMDETNFIQFCAFIALFGPAPTVFRKIGQFLQCPQEMKDALTYTDVVDAKEADEENFVNEFTLFAGTSKEKFFYNLVSVPTTDGEGYIVDDEGNRYGSWLEVFEEFGNKENMSDEDAEVEHIGMAIEAK